MVAAGIGVLNEFGRLIELGQAIVPAVIDPAAEFVATKTVSHEEILASAPGPDIDGGIDLTEDEFDEFMRAVLSS